MDDRLLRSALTANALLSATAGALTAGLAGVLAAPLGIPAPALVVVGLGLLPWSAALWWARSRDVLLRRDAVTAIVGDTAWVAASLVLLLASPVELTTVGRWVVALGALGVGEAALVQAWGLARMLRGRRGGPVSPSPTGRRPAVP